MFLVSLKEPSYFTGELLFSYFELEFVNDEIEPWFTTLNFFCSLLILAYSILCSSFYFSCSLAR